VAEGLSPSPIRENTEPNIQHSANKGNHRSSKHHKTKKGQHFREATRRLGCWGVDWSVAGREENVQRTICAIVCTVVNLKRINSHIWNICKSDVYYTFLLNNNLVRWTHPCDPWGCLKTTTSRLPVIAKWFPTHGTKKYVYYVKIMPPYRQQYQMSIELGAGESLSLMSVFIWCVRYWKSFSVLVLMNSELSSMAKIS
jgi:hypothetical protein